MQNGIVANPTENPIKDPMIRVSGTHFKYSEVFWLRLELILFLSVTWDLGELTGRGEGGGWRGEVREAG